MTDQQNPDLDKVKPIGTWARAEELPGGPTSESGRGAGAEPIPGAPPSAPLVDQPADREPLTSPETEHELDRLRRS